MTFPQHHRIERVHHRLRLGLDVRVTDQAIDLIRHIIQVIIHLRLPQRASCPKGAVILFTIFSQAIVQSHCKLIHCSEKRIKSVVNGNRRKSFLASLYYCGLGGSHCNLFSSYVGISN